MVKGLEAIELFILAGFGWLLFDLGRWVEQREERSSRKAKGRVS